MGSCVWGVVFYFLLDNFIPPKNNISFFYQCALFGTVLAYICQEWDSIQEILWRGTFSLVVFRFLWKRNKNFWFSPVIFVFENKNGKTLEKISSPRVFYIFHCFFHCSLQIQPRSVENSAAIGVEQPRLKNPSQNHHLGMPWVFFWLGCRYNFLIITAVFGRIQPRMSNQPFLGCIQPRHPPPFVLAHSLVPWNLSTFKVPTVSSVDHGQED